MSDQESNREPTMQEVLTSPAEDFINDPTIEMAWMSTAIRHMETYYKLITSVQPTTNIKLTSNDDIIFDAFKERFSDLNVEKLTESMIKSDEGKKFVAKSFFFFGYHFLSTKNSSFFLVAKVKWRNFCMDMKDNIEDYSFATLMRLNSREDYNEANTIVVPRAQFIAIEIARNRLGFNTELPPFVE